MLSMLGVVSYLLTLLAWSICLALQSVMLGLVRVFVFFLFFPVLRIILKFTVISAYTFVFMFNKDQSINLSNSRLKNISLTAV